MKTERRRRWIRHVYERGTRREPKKRTSSLGRLGGSGAVTKDRQGGGNSGDGTRKLVREREGKMVLQPV